MIINFIKQVIALLERAKREGEIAEENKVFNYS
jgi:hypothetical protein